MVESLRHQSHVCGQSRMLRSQKLCNNKHPLPVSQLLGSALGRATLVCSDELVHELPGPCLGMRGSSWTGLEGLQQLVILQPLLCRPVAGQVLPVCTTSQTHPQSQQGWWSVHWDLHLDGLLVANRCGEDMAGSHGLWQACAALPLAGRR